MPEQPFSETLQQLRKDRGLTQQQLADAAGLSQTAVSQWEAGVREPSWSAVRALAAALGVDCTAFTAAPGKKGRKGK